MNCNILQARCRPASSVQILGMRLQVHCRKHKIDVPRQEVMWMKLWAQVASGKLGKTAVETVDLKQLLSIAKIEAYAELPTKQRKQHGNFSAT